MYTTVNIHMNTGGISMLHNWRDIDMVLAENSHNSRNQIDFSNEFGDSFHSSLCRFTLKDKYDILFGKSLKEYNDKQKRSDRKITMDGYMKSVENDTRGKRQTKRVNGKKVADTSKPKGKRLAYEFIVAVGNTECQKDDGQRVCYDKTNHEIHPEYLPRDLQDKIIRVYCENFEERNPNFALVSIDIHGDELYLNQRNVWEYAAIHGHLVIVPFADGFKQGLSTQNSMNKAMAAMGIGYVKDVKCQYEIWCEKERKYLEELTYKMYEEYCRENPDFYVENGPLHIYHPVSDRSRMGGLDKETYAAKKELEEQQAEIRAAWDEIVRTKEKQDAKEREFDERELSFSSREIGLNAKEEMLKHKAEEDERNAEKNKLDAEANERVRKQLEDDKAALAEREIILKNGFEELEEEKEELRKSKERMIEEFNELVDKAAEKKAEEILKKKDTERKKERMGEKIYNGPDPSRNRSSDLKKRFK